MQIGYQGIKNSYSHQVCKKYLDTNKLPEDNLNGFKSFELVFSGLLFGLIDLAILPIENSIGGCIFMNFDLFYKYNIRIHCEFQHNIEHSLYGISDDISKIKKIISHPQALQQCKENLKKNNLDIEEYWDTTASIEKIIELNDESIGCIAPPGLGEYYGINELHTKFNDQENNITRFYLISLKDKQVNLKNLLRTDFEGKKMINKKDKFSGYAILIDKIGSLQNYLNKFNEYNINLTKIESRPYLGKDRINNYNPFSYIFYIEGEYNLGNNEPSIEQIDSLYPFYYFGKYSLLDFSDALMLHNNILIENKIDNIVTQENKSVDNINNLQNINCKLNIGIIGFGRFGQFIAEKMIKYGFNVYST